MPCGIDINSAFLWERYLPAQPYALRMPHIRAMHTILQIMHPLQFKNNIYSKQKNGRYLNYHS